MVGVEWSSDAVRDMFVDPDGASSNPTDPNAGIDPPGGNDNSDSNNSSSTPTGAIAGGVVGGVAGLALIGGLIFFLIRRKRKSTPTAELPVTPSHTSPSPGMAQHQSLAPKYEGPSPMGTSSNGRSELATSPETSRYELDAGGPMMELTGDYCQSPEGRNPSQAPQVHPHGFTSPQ